MKISACIIHRDDPGLERAVASIRPWVDEVVIVDTGSTPEMQARARGLADVFEVFTDCNDWQAIYGSPEPAGADDSIAHFSLARQRSFDIASHDAAVWLDSDDEVVGGEHLREALERGIAEAGNRATRIQFAYEYEYSERGDCKVLQMRERLVYPREAFGWIRPVHEGLVAKDHPNSLTVTGDPRIVWKHRRANEPRRDRARNLRILKAHARKCGEDVDVQTCFDLGAELGSIGSHSEGIAWLARYFTKSDWDDERVLAALYIVDMLSFWPGRENEAAEWAHRAIESKPTWGEGYWALAKLAHVQAARAGAAHERRHLERVVHFATMGLEKPPTVTQVPINPEDRAFNLPYLLQDALGRLGRYEGALRAAATCLVARPDDRALALKAEEYRLKVLADGRIDVVIACGHTPEAWDPETLTKSGIGGSETAVVELAKRLASRKGYRVRVYCRCDHPGLYDGVEYRPFGELDDVKGCDVFVAWRNAALLDYTPSAIKWLWVHDNDIFQGNPWSLHLADRILGVSEWHASELRHKHPKIAAKIGATRNGIDLARFDGPAPERHPRQVIYSSSPDRGLLPLLDIWPLVRKRVPDAELHVFYGLENFAPERKRPYLSALAEAQEHGVHYHDRVDQGTLAHEMRSAGVWVHPSWAGEEPFKETSCIGAMEAQAAGLRIVCGAAGALQETVQDGSFLFGDPRAHGTRSEYVEAIVEALTSEDSEETRRARQHGPKVARETFSWDAVATQWAQLVSRDTVAHRTIKPQRIEWLGRKDDRPTVHLVLGPLASGSVVMDAAKAGTEAMGGGSRAGFMGLARALAARGEYRVRAFSTFAAPFARDPNTPLECIRLDQLRSYPAPDAMIAYYDTSPLASVPATTLRIASHHTYQPYMHFDVADVNTAPSDVAMQFLRDRYDVPGSPWYVLPNGCDAPPVARKPVPGRIIYHTSPDRGLHLLLEAFLAIKAKVPHATLHVVGPVKEYLQDAKQAQEKIRAQRDRLERALDMATALGGVELLGRLPRRVLERELAEASVFAFPCSPIAPCETFSLSIMECCAMGLPVVLCPADALESIYAGYVQMVPGPAAEVVGPFADAVAEVLTDPGLSADLSAKGKALAARFTFERQADVLAEIIQTHLPEALVSMSVAAE